MLLLFLFLLSLLGFVKTVVASPALTIGCNMKEKVLLPSSAMNPTLNTQDAWRVEVVH